MSGTVQLPAMITIEQAAGSWPPDVEIDPYVAPNQAQALSAAITAEVTRAQGAEGSLSAALGSLQVEFGSISGAGGGSGSGGYATLAGSIAVQGSLISELQTSLSLTGTTLEGLVLEAETLSANITLALGSVASVGSLLASDSAALAGSIGSVGSLAAANSAALQGSITSIEGSLSLTGTQIGSLNAAVTLNTGSIATLGSLLATESAALAGSIGSVASLAAANSAALQGSIVSIEGSLSLTGTQIGSLNAAVTLNTGSIATLGSLLASESAALAGSIGGVGSVAAANSAALAGSISGVSMVANAAQPKIPAPATPAILLSPGTLGGNPQSLALSAQLALSGTVLSVVATQASAGSLSSGEIVQLGTDGALDNSLFKTPTTIGYVSTLTLDLVHNCDIYITLTGSLLLANPTLAAAGNTGVIGLIQDTLGGHTISFASPRAWQFPGKATPVLSTAASAIDLIPYKVRNTAAIECSFMQNMG